MAQVLLLIMATFAAISSFTAIQGFVLSQLMDEYTEEPVAPTPTPNHITRIGHSNELYEAAIAEVTKFIDAAPTTAGMITVTETASTEQRQAKALTYTELSQLLANWQLDKERNAYEMQPNNRREIVSRWN